MKGRRSGLTKWGSRKLFSATAGVLRRNYAPVPMRGGYRI